MKFRMYSFKERDHLGDVEVDGNITFGSMTMKSFLNTWIIWLRILSSTWFLYYLFIYLLGRIEF